MMNSDVKRTAIPMQVFPRKGKVPTARKAGANVFVKRKERWQILFQDLNCKHMSFQAPLYAADINLITFALNRHVDCTIYFEYTVLHLESRHCKYKKQANGSFKFFTEQPIYTNDVRDMYNEHLYTAENSAEAICSAERQYRELHIALKYPKLPDINTARDQVLRWSAVYDYELDYLTLPTTTQNCFDRSGPTANPSYSYTGVKQVIDADRVLDDAANVYRAWLTLNMYRQLIAKDKLELDTTSITGVTTCPHCGEVINRTAGYCSFCGTANAEFVDVEYHDFLTSAEVGSSDMYGDNLD